MLTTILFIIVLIVLILIHEIGHFFTAKFFGIKVEEFGLGFPPRIFIWGKGKTKYSLNWLPFGGFVKIKGENGEKVNDKDSFSSRPLFQRSMVLISGVFMNFLLAAILFSVGFFIGLPIIDQGQGKELQNAKVQILQVAKESPAEIAGLKLGDNILEIKNAESVAIIENVKDAQNYINEHKGEYIILKIEREKEIFEKEVFARENYKSDQGSIGISLSKVGLISYPWYLALIEGFKKATLNFIAIIIAIIILIKDLIVSGEISGDIVGPIGIARLTGQFYDLGISYLISFVGIISLNLAVLNILPIPALDGGRLFFAIIEKIRRKAMNRELEAKIHGIAFIILIVFIIIITFKDIF
ncbi:MAG: Membrane-associated zinc metalloprotease [Parcubacteria group bacterium GW2011_GWA2_31_28]|nr:MAG: Membrane-associated zinc metalloprotease [Parcubacteria group bacterium GW2011_GWA2_31_28]